MEKVFDGYKGIILFYVIVLILAIFWVKRAERLNTQAKADTETVIIKCRA